MRVLQDGKEVKDAKVFYDANGGAQHVQVDGVNYDAKAFTFEDEETVKKQTKPAQKTKKQSDVMTRADVKAKK